MTKSLILCQTLNREIRRIAHTTDDGESWAYQKCPAHHWLKEFFSISNPGRFDPGLIPGGDCFYRDTLAHFSHLEGNHVSIHLR